MTRTEIIKGYAMTPYTLYDSNELEMVGRYYLTVKSDLEICDKINDTFEPSVWLPVIKDHLCQIAPFIVVHAHCDIEEFSALLDKFDILCDDYGMAYTSHYGKPFYLLKDLKSYSEFARSKRKKEG